MINSPTTWGAAAGRRAIDISARIHTELALNSISNYHLVKFITIPSPPTPRFAVRSLTMSPLDHWHHIVFNRDLAALQEFLAEDVVFRSPYVWRPYHGRQAAWLILSTVLDVFQEFTYHRELIDGDNWALEFSARVGERSLKGIDLIRFDGDGRIIEFEVFVRPFNGLQALGEEMARRLAG